MTIKTMWDYFKTLGYGNFFFGIALTDELVEQFPFLAYYKENYVKLDRVLINMYGFRDYLYSDDTNVSASLADFRIDNVESLYIFGNALNQLYKALETEYNPLENYDRTEITNNYDMFGKITTVTGNDKATTTSGNTTNDSTTFYDTTKTVTGTDGRTDYINHHHDKHKTDSHVHGNIGVTTNVQMASLEVDFRRVYNFYQIMFDMLINNHTYYEDKGVDLL